MNSHDKVIGCLVITDTQKVPQTICLFYIPFIAHGVHILNPFIQREISPTYHGKHIVRRGLTSSLSAEDRGEINPCLTMAKFHD